MYNIAAAVMPTLTDSVADATCKQHQCGGASLEHATGQCNSRNWTGPVWVSTGLFYIIFVLLHHF